MSFRLRRAAAAVRSLCACVCMRHTVIVSRVAIAASAVASVASVVSVATVELVHVHILPRKCGHRALSSFPPFFGAPWGGVRHLAVVVEDLYSLCCGDGLDFVLVEAAVVVVKLFDLRQRLLVFEPWDM